MKLLYRCRVQYPSAWIRQVSRNHSMQMVLSIM
nr:MAG TPA: hypothetical protein [Caudoviricetes sp.]